MKPKQKMSWGNMNLEKAIKCLFMSIMVLTGCISTGNVPYDNTHGDKYTEIKALHESASLEIPEDVIIDLKALFVGVIDYRVKENNYVLGVKSIYDRGFSGTIDIELKIERNICKITCSNTILKIVNIDLNDDGIKKIKDKIDSVIYELKNYISMEINKKIVTIQPEYLKKQQNSVMYLEIQGSWLHWPSFPV
jgi:hypothetical protein